jgi:hypothetical protein
MCPLGRFLIDCSNAGPGGIPLNSPEAKQKGIDRYQKVSLPTIREILTSWDIYRITHNLPWADLRIFKEDVSGCFNQLNWSSNAAKLLCAMIDDDVIYIMLTGGFGHCVTPMVWSLFGEAITRRVLELARCPVHTFVDDSFGAGILAHALEARDLIQSTTRGVIGPSAISVEKSVLDTRAEILGFLIDLIKGTIRPKDRQGSRQDLLCHVPHRNLDPTTIGNVAVCSFDCGVLLPGFTRDEGLCRPLASHV